MDTDLLKAFVSVAELGSFSLAAEQLHLTQPAVSKRIAQLEEQLHSKLFDRIPRAVSLTESGRILLPRANEILRKIGETQQAIDDLSGSITGSLSVAISHHIGLHRIPDVLKKYVNRFPQVVMDVDFMDSEIAYDLVLHGKFEIAVITLAPEDPPAIVSRKIWDDPLVLVVSAEHPLAGHAEVNLNELTSFPAILPGMNTYTGRMIQQLFIKSGKELNATMATNYLETIKMMVSIGLGWSLLPETMLDSSLCTIPCRPMNLTRRLGYIHHRERTLSRAAGEFITLLDHYSD